MPGVQGHGRLSRMPSTASLQPALTPQACPRPSQESRTKPAVKAVLLGGPRSRRGRRGNRETGLTSRGFSRQRWPPGRVCQQTLSTCCWDGGALRAPRWTGSPGPRRNPSLWAQPDPALGPQWSSLGMGLTEPPPQERGDAGLALGPGASLPGWGPLAGVQWPGPGSACRGAAASQRLSPPGLPGNQRGAAAVRSPGGRLRGARPAPQNLAGSAFRGRRRGRDSEEPHLPHHSHKGGYSHKTPGSWGTKEGNQLRATSCERVAAAACGARGRWVLLGRHLSFLSLPGPPSWSPCLGDQG